MPAGPAEVEDLPVQLQPQRRGALADLALGLGMEHAFRTLTIDGHNNVTRPEVGSFGLALLSYL